MNLLPCLNELKPLPSNHLFYDCGFHTDFCNLTFETQLQILCDIVRQSIYPNGIPNPDKDILEMNGNCYTSSYCFLEYLKKLKIGKNQRCAIVRKRPFDLDEITSIHIVTLVDSMNGHTYEVDTTPFGGYKYGSVDDITYKSVYEECVIIDEKIKNYLFQFRKIIYDNSINQMNINKITEYLEMCNITEEIPILKGYVAIVLKILLKFTTDSDQKYQIQSKINKIKPYNHTRPDKLKKLKDRLEIETNKWIEELNDLIRSDKDYKRQLELAITIVQENKWMDNSFERYFNINQKSIRISNINPRFLYDNHYHTEIIKLKNKRIKCQLVDKEGLIVAEYKTDLTVPTEQKLIPIQFFPYYFENVIATTYSESSLEFLSGYPEHQIMTKFMYPNPRLLRKQIKI